MEMLPNDVRQHRFKKSVRGYDTDEVDQFLEHVATALEGALEARQKAEDAVARLEREVERFREQEGALKKAVLTVESAMESARTSALKDVESIKREAELRARQIIGEADLESRRLEQDLKFLKDSRQNMIEQIRAFCKAQLATLEGLEGPARERVASRPAAQPRSSEPPAPPRPPASAVTLPDRLTKPASAGAAAPRLWQPERKERDEVEEKISQALGVEDDSAVYPPPLVPQNRPQGDR
jgi:cell division initiation protein